MTMAVSLLKFSIVCGETTEPELNPTLTKLVTKLVSTKMSEGYGKATDVLYWLSIFLQTVLSITFTILRSNNLV